MPLVESVAQLTLPPARAVFVSFGGLLLYLEGPYKKLAPLRIDHLYLLVKK
jgi:DNA-directed RNA polymerase I, II, and III subunit RPABC3